MEDAPENLLPVLGIRQQQLQEIALGDHGYLGKLLPVQAQNLPDGGVHLLRLGEDVAVGEGQTGIGGLFGHTLAPILGAHVFGIAPDGVLLPGIAEAKPDKGGHLGLGVFGAEHGRLPAVPTGLPEQRIADGIKQSCFAGAGVPGDEV